MKKIHYSWIICAIGTLMVFCCAGLTYTGFAPYQPYLISVRGLTNFQCTSITFIRTLFSLGTMSIVSRLINQFGLRRTAAVGMLCCVAAFFTFGMTNTYIGCCAAAALAGCGHGLAGLIPGSILISRWFKIHNGLALGIIMASTGLSAFIGSPIITWAIENCSLRAAFVGESLFVLVSTILVYIVLRSRPACLNLYPLGSEEDVAAGTAPVSAKTASAQNKKSAHKIAAQVYASHAAPLPLYLAMCFLIFLFGIPGGNLTTNMSLLFRSQGLSAGYVSWVISLFGLALALGKCIYGLLSDHIGMIPSTILMYILVTVGNLMCCFISEAHPTFALMAAILMGFGLAVTSVAASSYALHISTEADYPNVVSRFQLMNTLGGLAFSTIPGSIADATGSYIPSYVIMLGITIFSSVFLIIVYSMIVRRYRQA